MTKTGTLIFFCGKMGAGKSTKSKYSALLRPLTKLHVQKILLTGTNVVLDFPANTTKQRAWLKSIAKEIESEHQLIYLEVSNKQCIKQVAKRRLEQP